MKRRSHEFSFPAATWGLLEKWALGTQGGYRDIECLMGVLIKDSVEIIWSNAYMAG